MTILREVRDPSKDERQSARPSTMKSADLEFGAVLLNCTILNMSPKGLQVCVPLFHQVPEKVTIHFGDGTKRIALQRWRRDTDIGFEFTES